MTTTNIHKCDIIPHKCVPKRAWGFFYARTYAKTYIYPYVKKRKCESGLRKSQINI